MNHIHPTAILGPDVTLGDGNTVGPYVVITGRVSIGDDNWIGAGAFIGPPPEIRAFEHPTNEAANWGGGVGIGNRSVVREGVQIHQGWQAVTRVGDEVFISNQTYVAHDCVIADRVTLASSVLLAGSVSVGADANLGLGAVVHQGRAIGAGAMVGMSAVVTRDVPPWAKTYGSPARVNGVNSVGALRRGTDPEVLAALGLLYQIIDPSEVFSLGLADPLLAPLFEAWADAR